MFAAATFLLFYLHTLLTLTLLQSISLFPQFPHLSLSRAHTILHAFGIYVHDSLAQMFYISSTAFDDILHIMLYCMCCVDHFTMLKTLKEEEIVLHCILYIFMLLIVLVHWNPENWSCVHGLYSFFLLWYKSLISQYILILCRKRIFILR